MLRSVEIKHLARDHFEIAFRAAMPAAQISAVETDHDRRGHCVDLGIWGSGRTQTCYTLADPAGPIPHRTGVDSAADGQQLGKEISHFSERRDRRKLGGHISELRCHAPFEHESRQASRLFGKRLAAPATLEPPNAERHVAKQGSKGHLPVPFAGERRSALDAASESLPHFRRLRTDHFGLDRGGKSFSLDQRKA
jgi:hypothetical protein